MGVNKCFKPCVGFHVLDLNDVSQGSCSIGSREVLQRDWVVVPFAFKLLLDAWQHTLEVNGGLSGRDPACGITVRDYSLLFELEYSLGRTKEEPKLTALLPLNATLATAFAKGMPFCLKKHDQRSVFKEAH